MALRRHLLRLSAAGIAVAVAAGMLAPAAAQFFDERFPFGRGPPGGSLFGPPGFPPPPTMQAPPPRPVDYSRAPPAKKYDKNDSTDLSTVLVLGDSMADWLGYGLEHAFADSPELTVVRRPRAFSGLIARNDIRNRSTDWPVAAAEILAKENPAFVVMMIGLGDREPIREVRPPPTKPVPGQKPGTPAQAKEAAANPAAAKPPAPAAGAGEPKPDAAMNLRSSVQDANAEKNKTAPADAEAAKQPDDADDTPPPSPEPQRNAQGAFEFKTEKWVELYSKRVDETIAALKAKGVPVFWVGLPAVRGARSMSEITFLNDIYRSRAEKAGIVYIDVWDGFVDEGNRFALQGPDFEGQIRRLRAADGVHFTQAGARKLAHYVDKEIRRAMTPAGPIAIALPVDPAASQPATTAPAPGAPVARPLAGPVIPLNATAEAADNEELAGATGARQSLADAVATRILVRGEALPVPAGRADDYVWPRRAPAPLGADPVVATTTLPMTPMLAERTPGVRPASAVATAAAVVRPQQPRAPRPPGAVGGQQPQMGYAQSLQAQREAAFRRGPGPPGPPSPFFFFFNR